MENKSIWLKDIKYEKLESLNQDINTDVLIIGGGLTGISAAYHLINNNLNVTLIDSDKIGFGVSSRTTGKLTYLQELIYNKLERNFGYEISKKYLESQKYAINLVKDIIKKNNIECDLTKSDSFTFTDNESEIKNFKKEEKFLKRAKVKYGVTKDLPLKIKCDYAIKVEDTYVFHPVKYIMELKKICLNNGIKIYENTKAVKLENKKDYYICYTNRSKIKAKIVVLCCHYPFFLIPGFIPLRTHIEKSYLTASKISKSKNINAITNTYPTKSIRYHNDKRGNNYILYVGNSHLLCDKLNRKDNYNDLINQVKKDINKTVDYCWCNHDLITNDNLPLIGRLSKNDKRLLIGTGYNTWGMTNASLAGKILSDQILGKENKYAKIFVPYRSITLDKVKNLFVNLYCNIKGFFYPKIKKNHTWYENNVRFENRKGKNVGVYIDENKKEHVVRNLCPHMKCSLIFNMMDKTWDCPCHGSRFDVEGNCIQGPSTYSIKIDKDEG